MMSIWFSRWSMSNAFEVPLVLRVVTCPYVAIINEVLIYVDDSASMRNLWTFTSASSALALWVPAHHRCVSCWTYQIVELVIGEVLSLCRVSNTSVRDWEVDVSVQWWLSSVGHCHRPFARDTLMLHISCERSITVLKCWKTTSSSRYVVTVCYHDVFGVDCGVDTHDIKWRLLKQMIADCCDSYGISVQFWHG